MRKILLLTGRELKAYFDSLMAPLLLCLFLGTAGYFTWLASQNIFFNDTASLRAFTHPMWVPALMLCIVIPALTMRLFAEEKKSGTLEILLTRAITDRQVIIGKYLSAFILILIALALTLPWYLTIAALGPLDHGATFAGYLSLALMSAAYISIGVFTSSLTSNQIVAFLLGLTINLVLHLVFFNLAAFSTGTTSVFFNWLSMPAHCESLSRGVVDTGDLVYFAGIIALGLLFTELSLQMRHAQPQAGKGNINKNSLLLTGAIFTAIVIALNWLAARHPVRIDLTANREYTLSQPTRNLLDNLSEPVTIRAFITEEVPSNIRKATERLHDLLTEYQSLSKGKITFEIIDPTTPALEAEAESEGILPLTISVTEKDKAEQKKAWLGAVFICGERRHVIPMLNPGDPAEYILSSALQKVATGEKPSVGFLTGHNEIPLSSLFEFQNALNNGFETEEVSLLRGIPEHIQTLCIISPRGNFRSEELAALDVFMDNGGSVLLAVNRVQVDPNSLNGVAVESGLEDWLALKGLRVNPDFVVDDKCGSILTNSNRGNVTIQFPYFPLVSYFGEHPTTTGLEAILTTFASSVEAEDEYTKVYVPLLFSSSLSARVNPPVVFDFNKKWKRSDYPEQGIVMAVAGEINKNGSKLVVVGDGDFIANGEGEMARKLQPDNLNFGLNCVEWLSDTEGLMKLRTRQVMERPLKQIEDSTRVLLKYTNFFLPLLLVGGYALLRAQMRKRIRNRRMKETW